MKDARAEGACQHDAVAQREQTFAYAYAYHQVRTPPRASMGATRSEHAIFLKQNGRLQADDRIRRNTMFPV